MTNPDISRIVAEMRSACADFDAVNLASVKSWADRLEAIAQQPSNEVAGEYVMVPKAEFVRALESIPVPKMSPLKQELFKAGTHAVIRAFNDVIAAAQEQP